jgi:hypothetical protein
MGIFKFLVVLSWCVLFSYVLVSFRLKDFQLPKKNPKWHLSVFGKLGLSLITVGSLSALFELFGGSAGSNDPRFNLDGSLIAFYGLNFLFLDGCLNTYRAWLRLKALEATFDDESD